MRSNKQHNWRPKGGPPTVQELSQANKVVLRSLQHNHFKSEIITLSELDGNESQFQEHQTARKRNRIVMLSSNLHKLDPFVDEEGLLRVGGRLKSSTSPYEAKHPLIVPKNSHVTWQSSRTPVSLREAASPRLWHDTQCYPSSWIPHYQWAFGSFPHHR